MNFKIELKQNLEASICKGDQPIINCETIKSKLTFSSDDNSTAKPTTTQKNFKFIFAKIAYFMLSLIMGVFIGGGIMYSTRETKIPTPVIRIDPIYDWMYTLDMKKTIQNDIKLDIIEECTAFLPETPFLKLMNIGIINDANIATIEEVTINRQKEVIYTPIQNEINCSTVNLTFHNKDGKEYIHLLAHEKDAYQRYRLESNLPYTTEELKLSFENKIGETLTKEFLNAENTGIFAQLKYDAYTRKYYLEHELKYNDMTYIAQYDSIQEKLVVKSLI